MSGIRKYQTSLSGIRKYQTSQSGTLSGIFSLMKFSKKFYIFALKICMVVIFQTLVRVTTCMHMVDKYKSFAKKRLILMVCLKKMLNLLTGLDFYVVKMVNFDELLLRTLNFDDLF